MFDNLLGKAYEPGNEISLAISPQVLMIILTVVSLIYIFYSIASLTAEENARFYYEKYIFPVMNFYLLGCCIGQSGYGCIFGVVDGKNDGSDKIKYTLSNIGDWHFAKYALIAGGVCVLFIFVVQILKAKKPGRFIRDILFMLSLSVFGYCTARFAMTVDGFLLKLLFLPTSALAFICQFMWPIGLLLWFIPTSAIAAMNRSREEREKKAAYMAGNSKEEERKDAPAENTAPAAAKFPSCVIDDQGNTWYLKYDSGDHAEYECRKTGARRIFWYTGDYVDFPTSWRY